MVQWTFYSCARKENKKTHEILSLVIIQAQ